MLVEFASAVAAVECALAIQTAMRMNNAGRPEAEQIVFRIGIIVGEVILEGDNIYGDGVNIVARLEGIAEPGGIVISEDAWRQVHGKIAVGFVDIGERSLKNIARAVRAYRIDLGDEGVKGPPVNTLPLSDKPSIAVTPFQNMSSEPEQEFFATVSLTTLLQLCRNWLGCASSPEIAHSYTRGGRSTFAMQPGDLACGTFLKAAFARAEAAFALPRS